MRLAAGALDVYARHAILWLSMHHILKTVGTWSVRRYEVLVVYAQQNMLPQTSSWHSGHGLLMPPIRRVRRV